MILGDFLHDLRSGLDALAWELCHVDDAKPLRDDKVQFPIFGSHKRWSAEKKWLESMPAVNLERIEQLQPFRQVSTSHQTLDVLSYLNNVDKHRGLVTTSADVRVVGMSLRGLSFGEGVSMPEVSLEQLVDGPVPIEDGLEILRTNFGAAFSGEPYDAHGTATVNVMVRFGGGHVEPIGEVMRQLLEGTTAVVEFVRRGADD